MKPIPYGRQNITKDDIEAVIEVLKGNFLTQGPKIAEFEIAFAKYVGSRYAVAVANGTAALHLSALALGVHPGDKVITTPITFASSANCVRFAGGEVKFADIDPNTFLLDVNKVRELLEASPENCYKGIIPVDFAGRAINMEAYCQLAEEFGLWIIEDACHAPGGYFVDSKGTRHNCGNGDFAELAVFSFHPVKHIATGEGGMITTKDQPLYKKLIMLRSHGITKDPELLIENHGGWYYEMQELGFNYRLTDFQAALGLNQLKRVEKGLERRREIAEIYFEAFRNQSFINPQSGVVEGHAYHLYIIGVDDRKGLYEHLRMQNIFTQVHYIPLHMMPYYRQFGDKIGDLQNAESYYQNCLSLPMYPTLTHQEQIYIIDKVIEYFN